MIWYEYISCRQLPGRAGQCDVHICKIVYENTHIFIHNDMICIHRLPTAARKSKASTPFCHLLREILIQVYIYSVAACCSIFHRVAACCSIFHRVAVCCSVFFSGAYRARSWLRCICMLLQRVATCCSVLRYVTVCWTASQCACCVPPTAQDRNTGIYL